MSVHAKDVNNFTSNYTTKTHTQQRLEGVPLIECCPLYVRDLVTNEGTPEGSGHHYSALAVASELIATESYLTSINQPYIGTAESYYDDFIRASGIGVEPRYV